MSFKKSMIRRKAWSEIFLRNLLLVSAAPDLLSHRKLQSEPQQNREVSHHSPPPLVVGVSRSEVGVSPSEVGVSRVGSRS